MTDQTDVQDRPLYLITVGDTEDSRYLPTRFGPSEDPDGIQRDRAISRMWELQGQGADPQAWLLTADQLADVDAGRLVLQDLPPDAFERLPNPDQTTPEAIAAAMRRITDPEARIRWVAENGVTDAQILAAWHSFTQGPGGNGGPVATWSTPDLSHLVHRVVRVHGSTRTIVAAFPDAADALAWADMLTTTDTEAGTRYEVPGVDAPTEAELAPYLQQVRDAKGGESE
jgi:hypothetical protein